MISWVARCAITTTRTSSRKWWDKSLCTNSCLFQRLSKQKTKFLSAPWWRIWRRNPDVWWRWRISPLSTQREFYRLPTTQVRNLAIQQYPLWKTRPPPTAYVTPPPRWYDPPPGHIRSRSFWSNPNLPQCHHPLFLYLPLLCLRRRLLPFIIITITTTTSRCLLHPPRAPNPSSVSPYTTPPPSPLSPLSLSPVRRSRYRPHYPRLWSWPVRWLGHGPLFSISGVLSAPLRRWVRASEDPPRLFSSPLSPPITWLCLQWRPVSPMSNLWPHPPWRHQRGPFLVCYDHHPSPNPDRVRNAS